MKVYELLHRITFDDNTSNAVVIFTDRHSYDVFTDEEDHNWFSLFDYLEEDVKKYEDRFWFVGTKDMCHELNIYLSD